MAGRDLVVIGGSAGGVEALTALLRSTPPWLQSTLLVAIHRSPELPGMLPEVLSRCCTLPARYAADGEEFRPGHVYVAPPDHHLLVSAEQLRVTRGPREHGLRPAIDPLFRTAAREHGARTVGVILSGVLDDGVEGLDLVKRHGGVTVVQRPEDAMHDDMPENALAQVSVDHALPASRIGPLLARLAEEPVAPVASAGTQDIAEGGDAGLRYGVPPGVIQPFACPECGGSLWQSHPAGQPYFRCHVGHTFTLRTLLALQDGKLEEAMWTALRSLEEHAALRRRLAVRARASALQAMAAAYEEQARRSEERADTLRHILVAPEEIGTRSVDADEIPSATSVTEG
jgi:two-component system chemotaxis response regulator CheB